MGDEAEVASRVLQFIPHLPTEESAKQGSRMEEGRLPGGGAKAGPGRKGCQRDRELNRLPSRGQQVQSPWQEVTAECWKLPLSPTQRTAAQSQPASLGRCALLFLEGFRNTARPRHQQCTGWAAGGSGVWLGRALYAVP